MELKWKCDGPGCTVEGSSEDVEKHIIDAARRDDGTLKDPSEIRCWGAIGIEMVTRTTPYCTVCSKNGQVTVPLEGYKRWRDGMFIQQALPDVPKEIREQLLTGTHPDCWSQLFSDV